MTTGRDTGFDSRAARFEKNIYRSTKGWLRLELVWWHLQEMLPALQQGAPLRILDAGCGMGQMALRLAAQGHEVIGCDISTRLLQHARTAAREGGHASNPPRFLECAFQELAGAHGGDFDLVVCHAVLEWLCEPQAAIPLLAALLRPGGSLSLMVYNVDALVFRNLMRGNFYRALATDQQGDRNSLTPRHPLSPQQVQCWLQEGGFEIRAQAGIRVLYDYMEAAAQQARSREDILAMEQRFATTPPFSGLGRYQHLLCRRR